MFSVGKFAALVHPVARSSPPYSIGLELWSGGRNREGNEGILKLLGLGFEFPERSFETVRVGFSQRRERRQSQ